MPQNDPFPLIAVDVGNNRLKFGRFEQGLIERLPEPSTAIQIADKDADLGQLADWLAEPHAGVSGWWIGSVNRDATTQLIDWLRSNRPNEPVTMLSSGDLPLGVSVPRPDMVGIDRLLDALAVNRLRSPGRAAVVVDVGSAITVDLVSPQGVFEGGAILPGIAMSAQAMHTFTDLLPLIDMAELAHPPKPVGTATEPAMRSGLFWGAVGAIRQLVERMAEDAPSPAGPPEVFITGGAGPIVAELVGPHAQHVPHLTLGGIALAAQHAAERA